MSVYQFTVELKNYKPRMWRRVLVNDDITVARLGYIALCIFRAEITHLMVIEKPDARNASETLRYEIPNPFDEESNFDDDNDFDDDGGFAKFLSERLGVVHFPMLQRPKKLDATKELMKDAVSTEKGDNVLVVNYDFGDDWEFKFKLEKILDESEVKQKQIPCVVTGKGYGIIEDCGGAYGLMRIAEAVESKSGEAYEDYRDWFGLDYVDLSYFDKDELNEMLEDELDDIQEAYENPDEKY